jgi:hypothetical protein
MMTAKTAQTRSAQTNKLALDIHHISHKFIARVTNTTAQPSINMKVSFVLFLLVSSAVADDGKKAMMGGKKGDMSIPVPDPPVCPPVDGAVFCNSGGLRCSIPTENCAKTITNRMGDGTTIVDTDACEKFCEVQMGDVEDYFIQFTPNAPFRVTMNRALGTPDVNVLNLCECFEKCAVWDEIPVENPGNVPFLFAVGENECDDIGTAEFCEGTVSKLCIEEACTDSKKVPPITFPNVDNQQACSDRCAAVDRDVFALNLASNNCFCLVSCTMTGAGGGQTSLFSLLRLDGSDQCPRP